MLAVSCSDDTLNDELSYANDASPLVVYASISGAGKATTRADLLQIHDLWSYVSFADGDDMGFYSSGGNWLENQGKGEFNNLLLRYRNGQFTDIINGVEFSPSNMNGSQIFMYFPYCKDMNNSGLELRREKDETVRCVDLLSSNSISVQGVVDNKNVALYGEFEHAFSELIIVRGKGFDNPPPGMDKITAVINYPYTNIKVNVSTGDTWSCTPKLVFDENLNFTETDARKWEAWKGGNFDITEHDEEGKPAWYVIVPTLAGQRSVVEYIELYDNEGNLLRVSSLKLSGGNTKYVDPGWRYPMEIIMNELVPTVNPYKIVPWNKEVVNLTDERARGISNESDFLNWVRAYNAYQAAPDGDEAQVNTLLKYGDSFVDDNGQNRSWHFYILSDLDFTNYSSLLSEDEKNLSVIIPKLSDILDGISTTFVNGKFINHTIKGLSKTFIDQLIGNGSVQNLDFIEPEVRNDESSDSPAGIIANIMEGTSVINCNIKKGTLYNPGGPAGMVAGKITDGMVNNCTLSGFIAAKSTAADVAAKIVGQIEGSPTFSGNDADAVVTNND